MRLEKIIARSRIIDLRSADMKGALQELLEVSVSRFPDLKQDVLLRGLLQRENTMTTYLGFGVALPHVRAKRGRRYGLAIGRSPGARRLTWVRRGDVIRFARHWAELCSRPSRTGRDPRAEVARRQIAEVPA